MHKLDPDDVLMVTKLDHLGRNAIKFANTVSRLEKIGVQEAGIAAVLQADVALTKAR